MGHCQKTVSIKTGAWTKVSYMVSVAMSQGWLGSGCWVQPSSLHEASRCLVMGGCVPPQHTEPWHHQLCGFYSKLKSWFFPKTGFNLTLFSFLCLRLLFLSAMRDSPWMLCLWPCRKRGELQKGQVQSLSCLKAFADSQSCLSVNDIFPLHFISLDSSSPDC